LLRRFLAADVNACLAAPCHETARCFDKAALEPDSGDGRECICKSNEQIYENDTVGCQGESKFGLKATTVEL
jgi:hypothetical protein